VKRTGTFHLKNNLKFKGNKFTFEIYSGEPAALVAIRFLLAKKLSDPIGKIVLRLGTTHGTNALLERKGAKVLLITTKGFKDVLEIGY